MRWAPSAGRGRSGSRRSWREARPLLQVLVHLQELRGRGRAIRGGALLAPPRGDQREHRHEERGQAREH
eukprot:5465246-Alexandrium_andersonii.AAC.1